MKIYEHIISLGFFCGTAQELERIGLRSMSSPFDWIISDIKGVMECIENEFQDFLKFENLLQYKEIPKYYFDKKYKFHFYHDFSAYIDLKTQLPSVKNKYIRRIERFNENIQEPTLFLRYIKDKEELEFIEKNIGKIITLLKNKNENNELIFIANKGIDSNQINIYHVEEDNGDIVARTFLEKNKDLKDLLCSNIYSNSKRNENLQIYFNNQRKKNKHSYLDLVKTKIQKIKKPYVHYQLHG